MTIERLCKRTISILIPGIALLLPNSVLAQELTYQAPRTEHGHPDFQGNWSTLFITPLERPSGTSLVVDEAQASELVGNLYSGFPDNIDPDINNFSDQNLARVKGELRSSIIVEPQDGLLPYKAETAEIAMNYLVSIDNQLDHPEQRPKEERCLESWGFPPMRVLPFYLNHHIVQTEDYVAIVSEDSVPLRVIHLDGEAPPDAMRSWQGHSVGHWEGDSLVVQTTHFRHDNPIRANLGRPVFLSGDARVEEKFTRVSDSELFYQYTVNDDTHYTVPWRGEFSFTLSDQRSFEYSCHEGNYSMGGALRGGRVTDLMAEERADVTDQQ